MKQELLKGLTEEQIAKVKACKNGEEILSLAKAEGVELNDEQLAAVSGGGCDPNACPTCGCVTTRWVDNGGYREYYCAQCGQFIKKTPIK